jgi:hypothetical protein
MMSNLSELGNIFFKLHPLHGIDEGEYIRPSCIVDVRQNNDGKGCKIYLDFPEQDGNYYTMDIRSETEVIREIQRVMLNYERAKYGVTND